MSFSLPPEILDLIVEHLYDDRETPKVCCVVSRSWVSRARRHLFACVGFTTEESPVESWVKAFPDPSNSPAHHTRDLTIRGLRDIIAATTIAYPWIGAFCHIVTLSVAISAWDDSRTSLVPLHGLSPTLVSLCLTHHSISPSEVFNLVCSFPSLETLSLISTGEEDGGGDADMLILPSMSPKFTGVLSLVMRGGMRSGIRRLTTLPGGLRFTRILVGCYAEDLGSITDLVSACRNTLESLGIAQNPSGASRLSSETCWLINIVCGSRCVVGISSTQPLQGHEPQGSGIPGRKIKRSMDRHGAPNHQVKKSSADQFPRSGGGGQRSAQR